MTAWRRIGRRGRRDARGSPELWARVDGASRSLTVDASRAPRTRNRDRRYDARSLVNSDNKLQILYPSKTAKNGSFERTSSGAARRAPTATSVYKNFSSTPRM